MRVLFKFMCVLALGVMGCSETTGTGGGDGNGGVGGDGGTGGTTGQKFPCTEQGIRDAIAEGGGPHTFDCDGPQTVVTDAEIPINNDVVLDGENELTIDGNDDHRVFSVLHGVTAELHRLTIARGHVVGLTATGEESGGGIFNDGDLTLVDSTVRDNTAEHGEDCSPEIGCEGVAGGIRNASGILTLRNTTVSRNTADVGGGILNDGDGVLTLTNSTVSGNTAFLSGGGIESGPGGVLTMISCTVAANTGGALESYGTATIASSLIDGECGDPETSNGYNIESPGDTCGFDQPTDEPDVMVPVLGLLEDNGGPTKTHALGDGSPAIDRIPTDDCEVETDQRGEPRPETGGTMCDIGAFEVQPTDSN